MPLRTGPAPSAVPLVRRVETARTVLGDYQVEAHVARVGRARYLDYTEVRRGKAAISVP